MADEPTVPQPATARRSPPLTNPFSRSAGLTATPIASWSSASTSASPASSSHTASFVSDAPQFSRKKARHIPLEQQRTALLTLARHTAALSHSQYSAPSSTPSSQPAAGRLVGANRRRQSNGSGPFSRSTSDTDTSPSSKHELERAAILTAQLSAGQQSVVDAVQAGRSVFFTGCAGTGKSFLLTYLKHSLPADTTYFTASTGLAAVNISGQTLHSFAGVGLGEGDPRDLLQRVSVQQHARRRWQTCRILVIDELSMIDGALFDKLEYVARMVRKNPLPFGGIQLILTGDFLQLPPVKSGGGFCFESRSWADCVPVTIELQSVFRQDDSSLVAILNNFRRGVVDKTAAASMQGCINRKFDTTDGIEATELYAMKKQVSEENDDRLAQLETAEVEYTALDKGTATYLEQLTRSCNAVERLVLKEGAQVMLLKNLTSVLVNGSRGVVVSFDVQDADDMQMEHRRVAPSGRWPRVKFTNGSEMTLLPERWDVEVSQKSVASRTQVPLMLAWSLTVHKCQGMTLDRVRLHLGSIFEYGQAYVALSRIRSLHSLSIKDKFPQHVIRAHPKAIKFYDELHRQNGHSNNPVPISAPPSVRLAPDVPKVPADIPDPYDDEDGGPDMEMSDELIAMAADDGNDSHHALSASQLVPSTITECDSLLSPNSLSSGSSAAFVRASTLSLSQPASSPARATIAQHFATVTTSVTTPVSAVVGAQPSITAANVRHRQLLLKRKTQSTDTQTVASAATPSTATSAGKKSLSSPPSPPGARGEEIDLVSDDEHSEPPRQASATIERPQHKVGTAAQQQQAAPTAALLPTETRTKLSAKTRSFASSPDQCTAPSTAAIRPAQPDQPAQSAPFAAAISHFGTCQLGADDGCDSRPPPPFHAARCTSHDSALHAQLDWNKENEPAMQDEVKVEGCGVLLERGNNGSVQWLYRCEMGCMFAVSSTM